MDDSWVEVEGVIEEGRLAGLWERDADGRSYLSGLMISGVHVTGSLLRAIPVGRIENFPEAISEQTPTDELAPLLRVQGEDPEEFSIRVAVRYRRLLAVTSRPARAIADHSGLPLPTVHGWIREARLRGHLPFGKRGKAG